MAARVVVTGLFALAGCSGGKPPEVAGNPPAPVPLPPVPPTSAPGSGGEAPRRLNPVDAEGRPIHRRPDGLCAVFLPPPPPPPGPTPSFQPPPTAEVACPLEMADPAWASCAFGEIERSPDGACVCHVLGNPPPPPRALERCPAPAEPTEDLAAPKPIHTNPPSPRPPTP